MAIDKRMLEIGCDGSSSAEMTAKAKVDSDDVIRIPFDLVSENLAPDLVAAILHDQLPESISLFDVTVDVSAGLGKGRSSNSIKR